MRDLTERKIPLALVTGSLRAEAEVTLKAFELSNSFRVIVVAEDISQSKPSSEGYLKGAMMLGVAPVDCIVIEDAPSGITAAVAAGMRCLAVTTTHPKEELQKATAAVDQLRPGCIDFL